MRASSFFNAGATKKKNALFSVLICLENHLGVQGFPSQALKDGKFGVALHWNVVYFNCVANPSHKLGVKYVRSSLGWYGVVADCPRVVLVFREIE